MAFVVGPYSAPATRLYTQAKLVLGTLALLLPVQVLLALSLLALSAASAPSPAAVLGAAWLGLACSFANTAFFVCFLVWVYRAVQEATERGGDPGVTPGWAVVWFVLPLVSYFRFGTLCKNLWQAFDGTTLRTLQRDEAELREAPNFPLYALCYGVAGALQLLASFASSGRGEAPSALPALATLFGLAQLLLLGRAVQTLTARAAEYGERWNRRAL